MIHEKSTNFDLRQLSENSYLLKGNYSAGDYAFNEIELLDVEKIQFLDKIDTIINPKLLVSHDFLEFSEGDGAAIQVSFKLSVKPLSDVRMIVPTSDDIYTDKSQLVFTPENWNINQTIEFSAIDDELVETHEIEELIFELESEDPNYSNAALEEMTVSIIDNDTSDNNQISGIVWQDLNRDQNHGANEETLSGWEVYLDLNNNSNFDASEPLAITDDTGRFSFFNVSTGDYIVRQVLKDGYSQTTPRNQFQFSDIDVSNNYDLSEIILSEIDLSNSDIDKDYHTAYRDQIGLSNNVSQKYDGSGLSVVVLDTGIDIDHPHFGSDTNQDGISDNIKHSLDFTNTKSTGDDGNGHGTHVAGIIAGSNEEFPGIAPAADIISLKVLTDSGRGSFKGINDALEWCIANADKYNIAAINMSLGDGSFAEEAIVDGYSSEQLAALNALGVCVVSASGNDYQSRVGVSYPSSDLNSLSIGALFHSDVGSIYSANSTDKDRVAPFSQRDDELTTVFAPGVLVPAAAVDGGLVQLSGTSMASPVVAGAVVLLQNAAIELLGSKLSPSEIESLLKNTGELINDGDDEDDGVTNTGLNFIRINIDSAIQELEMMAGPGAYKVSVLEGDDISDIHFGVDKTNSSGSTLGAKFVGTLSSDTIVTQAGLENYFGGLGNDTFISNHTNIGMFGGDGNDTFIISKLSDLNSVNGGTGFDTVVLKDIEELEGNAEIANITQELALEHVDIIDSNLDISDTSLGSISLINSSSKVSLAGSQVYSTIENSVFNIETAVGDDVFHLKSNTEYTGNLVAFNASNLEQTGTGTMVSIAGKLGFKGVINGNEGSDTIQLSNRSEAFFLHDAYSDFHESVTLNSDNNGMLSAKRISNIENILAGGGDDIIDLTSPDYLIDLNGIQIYGESGEDVLWGANNDEHLNGGSGDDVLFGGSGDDTLIGGVGSDVFEFVDDVTNGNDTILDFSITEDSIRIYHTNGVERLSEADFQENVLTMNGGSLHFISETIMNFGDLHIDYHLI
ncbi:S8 family serine peptidase [Planktomarina temperata]|nr:S8 family serine peptidase [Planktomarina temperata]